ncbi:hypothetical protein SRRS_33840 [Sporomusa rhizae]|uniref:hypothetical protein n=1 Tax=Sporomusa rhizae TaxID=357999 RepID=UPI00352A0752
MSKIYDKLKGGDLRSIGKAEEVVTDILNDKNLFTEVFNGMLSDDALIRMRSADAIEKVSRLHPEYLQPFKQQIIDEISQIGQQEVQWHIAQMFSRLEFQPKLKIEMQPLRSLNKVLLTVKFKEVRRLRLVLQKIGGEPVFLFTRHFIAIYPE